MATRAALIALAALLTLVGWWWWSGRPSPVAAVDDPLTVTQQGVAWPAEGVPMGDRASTTGELTVHVVGRVRRPGIVTLPAGSRVMDAVAAAGGLRGRADTVDVNLARLVVDGEQIVVGRAQPSGRSGSQPGTSGGLVNLNQATAADLEALPGIGPVLAERIVAWREAHGPFPSVDVLGEVSGIGDVLLENLRPLVHV